MINDFKTGVGFNIFIDLKKQEKLFRTVIPLLKQLDWEKEGAYFNYEDYENNRNKAHAKLWVRANSDSVKKIESCVVDFNLNEKENIDENSIDYYVIYSEKKNNLGQFDDFDSSKLFLIKIKEAGTKYAIKIKEELNVTPNTLTNQKLQEISEKIVNERPEIIKKFIEFHFIMNPLVHSAGGYETEEQVKQRCMLNMIK